MERRWQKWYDPEMPRSFNYPKIALKDMFLSHAVTKPDKPYLIINDTVLDYRTCNGIARRFANSLLELGVKKGDRVALMAPNIPQYVLALQACFKIGAIAVPTNPLYTIHELTHQFQDSGAETVIVLAMFADKVLEVVSNQTTNVKRVITIQLTTSPVDLTGKNVLDFNELVQEGKDEEPDIKVFSEDIAMLQYTGGTTGVAKGCCLTNANLLSVAYQTATGILCVCPIDEVKVLMVIPLYHIYGYNTSINVCLYTGGTIVLVPTPDLDLLLENIKKHQPTVMTAVPALIIGLNSHPRINEYDITCLTGIICGSAPLAVEVMKEFEEKTGARIVEGYGMSETCNVVTCNMIHTRKNGSVGVPWPDVDVKIVDIETGTEEMPIGESGEIILKGPQIMIGYWNNPEETAQTLKDGWLYTGDIGYMDEDGFVFIVDRKKDMILCSGFNVYPREIDEIMYAHPKILDACTVGVPDVKRGETVKVFIVLKPGESMTEQEVIEYCKENLAPYKVPTQVEFMLELPRTSVGKPMRRALRDQEVKKVAN